MKSQLYNLPIKPSSQSCIEYPNPLTFGDGFRCPLMLGVIHNPLFYHSLWKSKSRTISSSLGATQRWLPVIHLPNILMALKSKKKSSKMDLLGGKFNHLIHLCKLLCTAWFQIAKKKGMDDGTRPARVARPLNRVPVRFTIRILTKKIAKKRHILVKLIYNSVFSSTHKCVIQKNWKGRNAAITAPILHLVSGHVLVPLVAASPCSQ